MLYWLLDPKFRKPEAHSPLTNFAPEPSFAGCSPAVLRMAAQSLQRSESALGKFYRRMRTKLGAPKAITATAHKLARIVFHLLKTGQAYDDTVFADLEVKYRKRNEHRLKAQARALGFALVPSSVCPSQAEVS